MEINELINNELIFNEKENFTAIIGSNPSKGARSPLLWNYTFNKNNSKTKMHCFDVSEKNLSKLILCLKENVNFLGGAIAVPYKEKVFDELNSFISKDSLNIGAVNCLYRDKDKNLIGTNTDGEAALLSFKEKFGEIRNEKILILGLGGAGKAVSSYFNNLKEHSNQLFISGRSQSAEIFCNKLNCNFIKWDLFQNNIDSFDVIINCTSLGSGKMINISPIDERLVKKIKKTAKLFDIIYDPSPSKLLKISSLCNLQILDGKRMNLLQASLAYDYCIKQNFRKHNTFDTMSELYNKLN